MTDWLKHLLEWLKTSPRYFFPIAITAALILFAPTKLIEPIGLLTFREDRKPYLGFALLFSSTVILSNAAVGMATWIREKYRSWRIHRKRIKRLHNLTVAESDILRQYIEGETRTVRLSYEDGVASGLISAQIIYISSKIGDYFIFPHNIQPWAWDYLNRNRKLLGVDHKKLSSNKNS